ncbi:hypothetical protein Pcinc_019862 [Petrolisthes cinctipes]|uniref:Amino acid transporter n=1 Tax=Petrolisthes cinctipes TaxID=88211 RepID=A0AAE1FJB8_PETCI|nr:hypothetical protein Pcinc_019862 [Petrolisthes cinctipes]
MEERSVDAVPCAEERRESANEKWEQSPLDISYSPSSSLQHPCPPMRSRKKNLASKEKGVVNEAYECDLSNRETAQNKDVDGQDTGEKEIITTYSRTTDNFPGQAENSVLDNLKKSKNLQQNSGDDNDGDDNQQRVKLRKEIGLVDCVGLIVGNIIGSGIFVSPRSVLHYTGSVGMSLVVWVLSGAFSIVGALCVMELGTMIPQSGGNYAYIHEAYGPLPAFVLLWMSVTIGIPSSRAIGSLTFANYLLQPFFPVGQEPPQLPLRFVAILLILTLTFINTQRVRWAVKVQDTLAVLKVFVLVVIVLTGFYHLVTGKTSNFDNAFENTNWNPTYFATAFYHTLYAYEGWDSLNAIMEEVKDPVRNMPRAITISLILVITIYILTNVAYFTVLDSGQILSSSAVAVTFGQLTLGAVAWVIPIFVACSTGGALNGSTLSASRLLFVSARRGQLPKFLSYVHIKNNTPITALIFTASISMVMFMTSDVRVLINYISFSGNLMGLLCISTFFYFRIKHPDMHRPIKVWIGFPILYFIVGVFLTIFPAIRQPIEVVASLVVIATGLPVYYFFIYRQDKPKFFTNFMDKVAYYSQILCLAVPEEKEG